ncbi:MAG: LacI family DNA-binding transcriptional regulator, partial [Pseudomonadota bacterium]
MKAKPTISTIARQAGVSVSTVSQVLRGRGRISPSTRDAVLRVVEETGYVQNRRASAMRSGSSRDVGLLINNIANPFNAEVLVGANAYLQQHDYLVFVLDALDDADLQKRYLYALLSGDPSGLLWVPAFETPQQDC